MTLTWEKSPEKTQAEIEAIYEYKIIDYETFINNRHSDYFSGRRTGDVLTFVKHSGLFAHAFAFPPFQDRGAKVSAMGTEDG